MPPAHHLAAGLSALLAAASVHAAALRPDFGHEPASPEARAVARWVLGSRDNEGHTFVIVDKRQARIYLFEPGGRLRGAAPVLLGLAKGDDTVAGIGDRPLAEIAPRERTTPAGRFVAEPGHNAQGVDIVWIDYDAAVSMHRVLTSNPQERRLERLRTRSVADNRISYGCINLPVVFYERVLSPAVQAGTTIVYVLPETRPAASVFGFRGGTKSAAVPRHAGDTLKVAGLDGA